MPQNVFGYPVDLAGAWVDQSVYTFVLKGGDGDKTGFRPSLVVTREAIPQNVDLPAFATAHKRLIAEKLPSLRLVRERQTTVGELPAHECHYGFRLENPGRTMVQWHLLVLRKGWGYSFCGTADERTFAREKEKFESLARTWGQDAISQKT